MPLEFHKDRSKKIEQQYFTSKDYIVPFIEIHLNLEGKRILEIGCGEGGILQAFMEKGAICHGVDLEVEKIDFAKDYFEDAIKQEMAMFVHEDVYEIATSEVYMHKYDLVILKDTIEHIHGKEKLMPVLQQFLKDDTSLIFIGFPPWQNPFGGHQQMCDSKLKYTPWIHLLPKNIYKALLLFAGERFDRVDGLLDVYETGLSIEDFERYVFQANMEVVASKLYLVNPIYKFKFNMPPTEQSEIISNIPILKNFLSTTCYYLIKRK